MGNSFRTIAAYGSNGAQPHYEPTPITNVKILDNSTLVLDSGGQYLDGTTDVTRTLYLGNPTKTEKEAYTRVLIGLIQLSMLTFPENLITSVADVMARAPLWEMGIDYLHGTSHGVGSFSNVHECKHICLKPVQPRNSVVTCFLREIKNVNSSIPLQL